MGIDPERLIFEGLSAGPVTPDVVKRALAIFGCICAGILAVALIAAAIIIPRSLRLQKSGLDYVRANLPSIVDTWSAQALADRATPELMEAAKSQQGLASLFTYFRKLGKIKQLDEPTKGMVYTGTDTAHGSYTVSDYTIHGDFEGGQATIVVQLRKVGESWKFNGFRVNSAAFLSK